MLQNQDRKAVMQDHAARIMQWSGNFLEEQYASIQQVSCVRKARHAHAPMLALVTRSENSLKHLAVRRVFEPPLHISARDATGGLC